MRHPRPGVVAALAMLATIVAPLAAQDTTRPSTGEVWRIYTPPQSSLVFARDGSLIGEIGRQHRTSIAIATLPRYVPNAFVAIEDERFYKHNGVDLIGIAGALKDMVVDQRVRGASTITQQLAGIMHPDQIDRADRSPSRKLKEQDAAREMEKRYNKQQILEAYLNWLDFGRGWFGIEAAARHYFGTTAAKLTLAQAASLAAMPQSPPIYDPTRFPDRNRTRRNIVLDRMAVQGYITRADAERAKAEPVTVAPNAGMSAAANYFVDAVRQQADAAGIPVMNGGYRIHTTLDPVLQRSAVTALVQGTLALEKQPGYKHLTYTDRGNSTNYLQGAVVVLDPYTGDVRAWIGGRNYALAPLNRVMSRRQPGSAIKPIVYAKAMESGVPVNAIVPDSSLEIPLIDGTVYRPGNVDNKFLGPITVREALVKSRNSVSIQLGMYAGMDSVADLAKRLGAPGMHPYPASAIGASELRPLDLVTAYTAFANNGQVVAPRFITRIEDLRGSTVYGSRPSEPKQVLDPRIAYVVRDVLREAVERGTGTAARRGLTVDVAGKTGTTNDNVDVWFAGMTPDLVGVVWLGFDRPKSIASAEYGGTLAAPIFAEMMRGYYAGRRPGPLPPAPDGLAVAEIDRLTGELATPDTPNDRRRIEFFLPGTEPMAIRGNPWTIPRWGAVWY